MRSRTAVIAGVVAGLTGLAVWWLVARDPQPRHLDAAAVSAPPRARPAASDRSPPPSRSPRRTSNSAVEPNSGLATPGRGPTIPSEPRPAWAGPDEAACDDGDPCTFRDRVAGGVCRGQPLQCDDDNPLTDDACAGDGCRHAFVPGAFEH